MGKMKVSKNGVDLEVYMDLEGYAKAVEYQRWKGIWVGEYDVCTEWETFSAFYAWVDGRARRGMQLSCRFVGDGKMHSPETSVFIPAYIRQVFRINSGERTVETGIPLGVTKNNRGDKYRARSTFNGNIYRGPSRSWPEEAHADWQPIKVDCLHRAMEMYRKEDCFDQRVEDKIYGVGWDRADNAMTAALQTPATDAAIAEIGAKAIENAINAQIGKSCITDKTNGLVYINLRDIQAFATNLRAGRKE